MKLGVFCFVTVLACAAAYTVGILSEEEFNKLNERNPVKPDEQNLESASEATQSMLSLTPKGIPEYVGHPVAPYINEKSNLNLIQSLVDVWHQILAYLNKPDIVDDILSGVQKQIDNSVLKKNFNDFYNSILTVLHWAGVDTVVIEDSIDLLFEKLQLLLNNSPNQ